MSRDPTAPAPAELAGRRNVRRRPVAMVVHAYYEEDPRVRREAEAVAASGREVDVFALRHEGLPATGTLDGVRVHRLDVQRHQGAGIGTYLAEYLEFIARACVALTRAHRHRRYALVQVHTIPDALVLAALPLRLTGVPVVIDLHEAMPEFFRMRFPRASNRVVQAALVAQERCSIAMASAAITVNDALGGRLVKAGVPAAKVTIVRNSPSLARFDPAAHPERAFMADGTLRLVYAGALSTVYEVEVALQAVAQIAGARPDLPLSLELYGRDFAEVPLRDRAATLGVADRTTFHGRIPIEAVPAAIAAADIGLAPTRRTEFTDLSLSTKVFEYAAMGKPVVASALPMVEATFPPGTVATYAAGSAASMADAILTLVDDPAGRAARVFATRDVIGRLAWEHESVRYLALVERLARDGSSPTAAPPPGSRPRARAPIPESPEGIIRSDAAGIVDLAAEALNERSRALKGSRVGVIGVAFKPDVQDDRNSPAAAVLAGLVGRGAEVRYHDPFVREFRDEAGRVHTGVGLDSLIHWADVFVVVTGHRSVDWDHLYGSADLVVDTVNSSCGRTVRDRQVLRLGAGWTVPAAPLS